MYRRLRFVDNKLVHAVINCDFAAVKRILDSQDYDKEWINDIGGYYDAIPIFLISYIYNYFFDSDYPEKDSDFFKTKHEENTKILHLFKECFGFENAIIEGYNDNYSESYTYILEETNPQVSFEKYLSREGYENYKKNNISKLDLKLCYAIDVMESYHAIKKYCELGANPKAIIKSDSPIVQLLDTGINAPTPIEIAELGCKNYSHNVYALLKEQSQEEYSCLEIIDLFDYALFAQNYRLLKQYCS